MKIQNKVELCNQIIFVSEIFSIIKLNLFDWAFDIKFVDV